MDSNAHGTLQRTSNFPKNDEHYLPSTNHEKTGIVYMDDGLTFAKTKEELEEFTKEFLQLCAENDLFIKCAEM